MLNNLDIFFCSQWGTNLNFCSWDYNLFSNHLGIKWIIWFFCCWHMPLPPSCPKLFFSITFFLYLEFFFFCACESVTSHGKDTQINFSLYPLNQQACCPGYRRRPFRCNSTNRQSTPIEQNCHIIWTNDNNFDIFWDLECPRPVSYSKQDQGTQMSM